MDSTPFSKKCEILHDFYISNAADEYWHDLITMQDLGFPAAVLVVNGGATLTDIGKSFVEETWQALCNELGVDHHGNYEDFISLVEFANE